MYRGVPVAVAMVVAASTAHASEVPLYQPAPSWIAAAPPIDVQKASSDQSMMVLFDQQQRLENGERWVYVDTAMRAISAEMLPQMGTVTLPWHPAKGDLIIHRVELLRGTETIDLVKAGSRFSVLQREQQLEQQSLTGILSATLPIEGLRIGDIVRMSFSVTQKDPALGGNVEANAVIMADPVKLGFGRIRMIWPEKDRIGIRPHAQMQAVKPVRKGGYQELTIALPLAKQPEMPDDAPLRYRHPPLIEASSFASWADVSKTAAPLYRTDGLIAPGSALAGEVAKIAAAESDPRRRVAAALRLVQDQVRYLFRGMDNGNYVPQIPARTWELRYGDCKAKTLLLLAILHALEIKAEPVLTSTTLGDWVPQRLPSFGAFDHVLVSAEVGGKTLWLDGTASGHRIEDLDDVPPFRIVLPARAAGAELVVLPSRAQARPDLVADIEFDQTAGISFPPTYTLSLVARGRYADMLRMVSATSGEKGLKEAVSGIAGEYSNGGSTVSHSVRFDDEAGAVRIEAAGLANLRWPKENERHQVVLDKVVRSLSFEPDRSRAAWMSIPVMTPTMPAQLIRTRVRLPDGAKGFELQGSTRLDQTLAGYELSRTARLEGGVISLEERSARRDPEIAAADIAATRESVALANTQLIKAMAPENYPPRWQLVQQAKGTNRFAAILAMYQKDIDGDTESDEPRGYLNRASFFEGIYDYRRALADVEQVVKQAPDADAHLWRARMFIALGEPAKALADAETALRLDPSSAGAIGMIAGLRQEKGEGAAALKLLDDRIASAGSDKQDFMAAKAEILGKMGRVDEAVRILDAAIATKPGNHQLLNSRCWLKGTRNIQLDTALKDCTRAIELAESPVHALDSRAMVYFRMGRLDEALEDLEAAYRINSAIPAVLYMRAIVRSRLGKADDSQRDLAGARMISPQIDKEYAGFGIQP